MNLLYRYSKQYWTLFIVALLLAATNQIFSLLDPLIFRHVIDNYATKYHDYTQGQFIRGAGLLVLAAMGVAFVSRVAKNFQDYFTNVIVQRLGAKMYSDGIRHSLDLPYQVFEDQRSGETLGKLQKVRSDVERFITAAINVLFISVVGIVFVMVYAFRVHWSIAPAFLVTVPLLGIISSVLSRKIKKIQKTIVAETTALAGSTTESLRNIELVKSLGLAHQEVVRLNGVTEKILKLELKKVKYLRSLSFIQGTAVNALRTSILFLMLYLIFRQEIAFVGPSGAGKSTLVKLLVGLYATKDGTILYNGIPSSRVDLDLLREKIGFVTQDTQLFSGSIRENLLFVNPTATDAECMEVLEQAAAHSLLSRADRGLDTLIGEGGVKVSGGEKQRLSIARALLRHPQLLVFDEATSSLDSLTEEEISRTIREVAANQEAITILIAHRLSTIMHADRIFVLERGRIVEFGRHAELLDQKGLYYAMWRQQVGEREAIAAR